MEYKITKTDDDFKHTLESESGISVTLGSKMKAEWLQKQLTSNLPVISESIVCNDTQQSKILSLYFEAGYRVHYAVFEAVPEQGDYTRFIMIREVVPEEPDVFVNHIPDRAFGL